MNIINATEAKELVEKYKATGLNFQRRYILDRIKGTALTGNTIITLDYIGIKLFEDDYKFFESLGYNVVRDQIFIFREKGTDIEMRQFLYGQISW